MTLRAFALASLALAAPALAQPAFAAAPQPAGKIELTKLMGRWYEVARIPNKTQADCQAATSDWTRTPEGYLVVQTCHKGEPDGPKTEWKGKAKVIDPVTNAKLKMSFFGGLVSQEYWILDRATDQGWLIMGTPGGNYVWLMSQRPSMAAQTKAQALARIKQLGYDIGRLEFPKPARD